MLVLYMLENEHKKEKSTINRYCLGNYDYYLMKQREDRRLKNNQASNIKQGKGSKYPREDNSMSFPSGVTNFCYGIIPLQNRWIFPWIL
jgi:hypothetical protein